MKPPFLLLQSLWNHHFCFFNHHETTMFVTETTIFVTSITMNETTICYFNHHETTIFVTSITMRPPFLLLQSPWNHHFCYLNHHETTIFVTSITMKPPFLLPQSPWNHHKLYNFTGSARKAKLGFRNGAHQVEADGLWDSVPHVAHLGYGNVDVWCMENSYNQKMVTLW